MSLINSLFNLLRFNRKNWKAVLLCIFAATVFWFFNALNKSYSTNIKFPITFDYNQENYIAVRPLPNELNINVSGIGWNLFRRSLGLKVPPLVIPLERPSETKKIVGSTLPPLFSNQVDGYQINFVLTDTLYVALEPKSRRKVALKIDVPSILLKKGYIISSDPLIDPDTIEIEGPWKLLTGMVDPVYLKLSQRNIDEDFKDDVEVSFLNSELISRNPPTVQVRFKVEKLIQVNDSVRLELVNMPRGAWPAIGNSVPCIFGIPESLMGSYRKEEVKAVVDLKGFVKGKRKFYPIVEGLPPFSKVLKADSVIVKF
jgi:hypothetical protein